MQKRQARDFLSRVDTITAMGYPVLVSSYFEYFMLAGYLRRVTKESIVIAMGLPAVKELFNPSYYEHLEGGILEVGAGCVLGPRLTSIHRDAPALPLCPGFASAGCAMCRWRSRNMRRVRMFL